jgi:hypothetical protein
MKRGKRVRESKRRDLSELGRGREEEREKVSLKATHCQN